MLGVATSVGVACIIAFREQVGYNGVGRRFTYRAEFGRRTFDTSHGRVELMVSRKRAFGTTTWWAQASRITEGHTVNDTGPEPGLLVPWWAERRLAPWLAGRREWPGPQPSTERAELRAVGWPARMLCEYRPVGARQEDVRGTYLWTIPEMLRPSWATPPMRIRYRMPYSPVWSGVVTNGVAYGAVWLILLCAPAWIRARTRERRGRCSECGYSRAGLADGDACPECGAPS